MFHARQLHQDVDVAEKAHLENRDRLVDESGRHAQHGRAHDEMRAGSLAHFFEVRNPDHFFAFLKGTRPLFLIGGQDHRGFAHL